MRQYTKNVRIQNILKNIYAAIQNTILKYPKTCTAMFKNMQKWADIQKYARIH